MSATAFEPQMYFTVLVGSVGADNAVITQLAFIFTLKVVTLGVVLLLYSTDSIVIV